MDSDLDRGCERVIPRAATLPLAVAGVILLGTAAWLAFGPAGGREGGFPGTTELPPEKRVELLSHKIAVLGARQGDAQELREELRTLKEQIAQVREIFESEPWARPDAAPGEVTVLRAGRPEDAEGTPGEPGT